MSFSVDVGAVGDVRVRLPPSVSEARVGDARASLGETDIPNAFKDDGVIGRLVVSRDGRELRTRVRLTL